MTYARSYKVVGKPIRAGATHDKSLMSYMAEQLKDQRALTHNQTIMYKDAPKPPVGGARAGAGSDVGNEDDLKYTIDKSYVANRAFKESKTLKITPFAVHNNEILVRITNLEDKFDGLQHVNRTIYVNLNEWAREFYLEANLHNKPDNGEISKILDDLKVNITEMTLSGSITIDAFMKSQAPSEKEILKITKGPPCNEYPDNSPEGKPLSGFTNTPTGSGLAQKKYFEEGW